MRFLPHPCSTVQQLESDLELNKTASFLLELGDLQCKVDLSGGWTEEMGPPLSQSCSGSTSQIGQSSGHRKSDKGRGSNWKMKRMILK